MGNAGSGEWSIILCLFPLPRGGGWGERGYGKYNINVRGNMYVAFYFNYWLFVRDFINNRGGGGERKGYA